MVLAAQLRQNPTHMDRKGTGDDDSSRLEEAGRALRQRLRP